MIFSAPLYVGSGSNKPFNKNKTLLTEAKGFFYGLKIGKYLKQKEKCIDETQSWVRHKEQNEVGTFGVHEATCQVVDHGDVARLPGPDHDNHNQEKQNLGLSHVKLTCLLTQSNFIFQVNTELFDLTYRPRGKKNFTERSGQLDEKERKCQNQVDDVVWMNQLSKLSLR